MRSGASAAVIITAVRNVEDDAWWERLEIEVKNVSTKPVYYLEIDLNLPDVVIDELAGSPRSLVIPLMYGRRDLMRNASRATPDDTPIKAGEIYTFKIPKRYWEIQDRLVAVKRLALKVYSVSFGDGTGFKAGGIAFSS